VDRLDSTYWNDRYLRGEIAWDAGAITTPLKDYFDQIENNKLRILIPGAGNAYEAEYLSNNGFKNVYVVDLAELPLENLLVRCPSFNAKHLIKKDFFDLTPADMPSGKKVDLIIEQTFFCALSPILRQNYFAKCAELLKPGGRLVGLLFNDPLNADKPPFGGSIQEYPFYFQDLFDVVHYEPAYNSIKPRAGREIFINLKKKKKR